MRKNPHEYYTTLGLSPGATPAEIRQAYRQLIQRWHPDHFKAGSFMQTTAEDMTKELNEAYEELYKKQLYRKFPPRENSRKVETGPVSDPAQGKRKAYQYEPPPPPETMPRKKTQPVAPEPAKPKTARPRPMQRPAQASPPVRAARKPAAEAGRKPKRNFHPQRWIKAAVTLGVAGAGVLLWRATPRFSAVIPERSPITANSRWPAPPAASPVAPSRPISASKTPPVQTAQNAAAAGRPVETAITPLPPITPPTATLPRREWLAATAINPGEWNRFLDNAESLIDTFERGDSKLKVLALQGTPEESTENIFRYGSSVVYFRNGVVTGWTDGLPRLRIHPELRIDFGLLDSFTVGSSRQEVVRAQGQPTALIPGGYAYRSSAVFFENDRVTRWIEADQSLRTLLLTPLWFDNTGRK